MAHLFGYPDPQFHMDPAFRVRADAAGTDTLIERVRSALSQLTAALISAAVTGEIDMREEAA
jgi:hypothetical protein